MKVLFTGGGSGGHFYPIVAVAEELKTLLGSEGIVDTKFYFVSDDPYNKDILDAHDITFIRNKTGKLRLYFSLQNIGDFFLTFVAVIRSFFMLYRLMPDVVFSKGAYPSFPVIIAARLLGIPVIVHESDTVPGRANRYAGSFAKRVAVSYPEAAEFFPPHKVARTGNPIRKELLEPLHEGSYEYFGLRRDIPTIFIVGGSQGAQRINDTLLRAVPELLGRFQIVHQVGAKNIDSYKVTMDIILEKSEYKDRYVMFPYLDLEGMRRIASIADLVVSRGGSTLFEIAAWGTPAIVIPITQSNGNHQMKNAYAYARAGAGVVIEEENLTARLFIQEVDRIFADQELIESMQKSANAFATQDAAKKIAKEVVAVLKEHQLYERK